MRLLHTQPNASVQPSNYQHLSRRAFSQGVAAWAAGSAGGLAAFSAAAQPSGAATPSAKPAARATPSELSAFPASSPWALMGSGVLRFFGFKAYEAHLWTGAATTNPLLSKSLFALEIEYSTAIKAEEIVNVSLVEMARLRSPSDAQIKSWSADLKKAFPDVKSGDKLTGVYVPKLGTRFFFNSRLTTEISDPAFGDAFFAIWLDDKAKKPELRRALLGQG
jgi:Chalcone isomerase-like